MNCILEGEREHRPESVLAAELVAKPAVMSLGGLLVLNLNTPKHHMIGDITRLMGSVGLSIERCTIVVNGAVR